MAAAASAQLAATAARHGAPPALELSFERDVVAEESPDGGAVARTLDLLGVEPEPGVPLSLSKCA